MFSGTFIQCKIGFMQIVQIIENKNVTIVLKINETMTERRTPGISFAPYFWPVITAKPFVRPTITNIIRKNTGETAPTAAKG